jgi:hypothetical protein
MELEVRKVYWGAAPVKEEEEPGLLEEWHQTIIQTSSKSGWLGFFLKEVSFFQKFKR